MIPHIIPKHFVRIKNCDSYRFFFLSVNDTCTRSRSVVERGHIRAFNFSSEDHGQFSFVHISNEICNCTQMFPQVFCFYHGIILLKKKLNPATDRKYYGTY